MDTFRAPCVSAPVLHEAETVTIVYEGEIEQRELDQLGRRHRSRRGVLTSWLRL